VFSILIIFITGLYDIEKIRNNKKNLSKIALSAFIWFVFGVFYFYASNKARISPKTILLLNTIVGFLIISGWRMIYNKFISQSILKTKIAFTGSNKEVKEIIKYLENKPQLGYKVVGFIIPESDTNNYGLPTANSIEDFIEKYGRIDLVVVSPEIEKEAEFVSQIIKKLYKQINVAPLSSFYEELIKRIPTSTLDDSWLIYNLQEQNKKIYDRVKLILDLFYAIIMAIFFVISFPFIAIFIKITSPGKIFFKQTRVGQLGRKFFVYKYRTMKSLAKDGSAEINGPQFSSSGDTRITTIGKILRKTRLDEIPQFINIFKRDMSIIGPRPERPEFVEQIKQNVPYYSLRHLIRPGLTGWAQIKHGYTSSVDENLRKLEYDLFYIKNRGPLIDFVITLRTINTILRFSGK
jgi:exopolysaccharide biosynthesis polyprenyl glycosylphosphotransferase